MTTSQTWVLLGIVGVMASGILVLVQLSFGSLRREMGARFDAVDSRFDAVGSRFDAVDRRLDGLDRDVQALVQRVFRDRE